MNETNVSSTKYGSTSDYLATFRIVVCIFIVSFLCLAGFFGNSLTIVILRSERKTKNTTTLLLQVLALVDTLYLSSYIFIQTLRTIERDTNWWPALKRAAPYIQLYSWPCASIFQTLTLWCICQNT